MTWIDTSTTNAGVIAALIIIALVAIVADLLLERRERRKGLRHGL